MRKASMPLWLRPVRCSERRRTMRAMALDIGDARVGVAISDAAGKVASPLKVLPAAGVFSDGAEFRRLVEDWEPDVLVCGLPYTMAGEEGPQAQGVRARAEAIARARNLPLEFVDERMSSASAKRILREEGLDERSMRGKVDMIAASIFLQTWLDSRNAASPAE